MTKKLYTLYIDESGIADLTDHSYLYFLLTSVAVENTEFSKIEGYFDLIKRKYNLEGELPFHTYDLLEKPDSPNLLTPTEAKDFVGSMCEFIRLVPFTVIALYTKKKEFLAKYKITAEDLKGSTENKARRGVLYYLSSLRQLELFSGLLERNNGFGSIHADSRTYQDRELLEAFLNIKQRNWKEGKNNPYFEISRQRLNSITFADKNAEAAGIQLVDFISFVIFAHLNRKMNTFHRIGLHKVWKEIKDFAQIKALPEDIGQQRIKQNLKK